MKKIEARNIHKSFQELNVLQGIDLDVEEGEVIAVIGPSGSGKSTLLRCLNKLETINRGTIIIDGELLADTSSTGEVVYAPGDESRRIACKMGMVFQQFNLFPQYTALENVTLAERLLAQETPEFKKDKKAILTRIDEHGKELLDRMGLAERMNHYPHQLSGGQQQRVAIARALALKPDILCFDEPTSALDPELTGEVLKVIRSLAQQNTTMIIVTHEMAFARDVADQVIFMDGGVIVEHGDPHEVIDHPKEERTRQFLTRYANG